MFYYSAIMKGDVEYAGHTPSIKEERRQTAFTSNIGAIAIIGFLIAIVTAGTIFSLHILQKVDKVQVSTIQTITEINRCLLIL